VVVALLYITQFETGTGGGVLVLEDVTRGTRAGSGVALWLGIESEKIEVGNGVGDCCRRLLLSESLVILFDDKDDVVILAEPHAANNTIRERLSNNQYVFTLKQ
jgi:hypothetical protein